MEHTYPTEYCINQPIIANVITAYTSQLINTALPDKPSIGTVVGYLNAIGGVFRYTIRCEIKDLLYLVICSYNDEVLKTIQPSSVNQKCFTEWTSVDVDQPLSEANIGLLKKSLVYVKAITLHYLNNEIIGWLQPVS